MRHQFPVRPEVMISDVELNSLWDEEHDSLDEARARQWIERIRREHAPHKPRPDKRHAA